MFFDFLFIQWKPFAKFISIFGRNANSKVDVVIEYKQSCENLGTPLAVNNSNNLRAFKESLITPDAKKIEDLKTREDKTRLYCALRQTMKNYKNVDLHLEIIEKDFKNWDQYAKKNWDDLIKKINHFNREKSSLLKTADFSKDDLQKINDYYDKKLLSLSADFLEEDTKKQRVYTNLKEIHVSQKNDYEKDIKLLTKKLIKKIDKS